MAVLSVSRSTLAFPAKYNSLLQASDVTPEILGGMVLLTPTSIDVVGTSATIGANGSVEFTAITELSLNGIFSSEYDNYMLVSWAVAGTGDQAVLARMRLSEVPESGSNYTLQQLAAQNTVVNGVRLTSQTAASMFRASATQRTGSTTFIYGPALAQPTAWRQVTAEGLSSAGIIEAAVTHSVATAYDGVTFIPTASSVSGLVSVYGLVGA